MNREDIEFQGEGGLTLRGWFYPAKNTSTPAPVIVLTHGLSCVKEMHLDISKIMGHGWGPNYSSAEAITRAAQDLAGFRTHHLITEDSGHLRQAPG